MKKFLLLLAAMILVTGGSLMSQTFEDALAGHFSAIGQDNLLKVNSRKVNRENDAGRY